MSVYMTEEEQVDAIKSWFKRHGNTITILISAVLLGIAVFKYWNMHKAKVNQQASVAYEHLMLAASNHDEKNTIIYANQLINDYNSSVYADAAHLMLAKNYVTRGENTNALQELEQVVNKPNMDTLKQVAMIRIARIYEAEGKFDKALDLLSSLNESVYKPIVNELSGDIYAAKGEYKQAAESYRFAIQEVQTQGMENLFLEMKSTQVEAKLKNENKGDTSTAKV